MGAKNEARLTSSLLARKGSAQPFPAADVFSLPPQTVVNPDAGMDEQAVGRRPHPEGWSSSPVTPATTPSTSKSEALEEQDEAVEDNAQGTEDKSRPVRPWSAQSIFSALKNTPALHPASDEGVTDDSDDSDGHGPVKTSREVSHAPAQDDKPGGASDASSAKDRVALTLRVDQDRHTRLRVLAAQTRRSSQDILLAALDSYIDVASQGMGFCDCLKPNSQCCKAGASD